MFDEYSPHIYVHGKPVRMRRGADGLWVTQIGHAGNKIRAQDVVWKNGDEDDVSRILEFLRNGPQVLYNIGTQLGIGFRRAERLLNLLLVNGDVEVERRGHSQQWQIP